MIDREWQRKLKAGRENRLNIVYQHRLRMERGGPVSSHEVYQRSHMKRGLVSEYITTRAKNVTEMYSDMMEEKYGQTTQVIAVLVIGRYGSGLMVDPLKKEDILGLIHRARQPLAALQLIILV